ncbi:unnamed protein product [Commensalibacter communis]|nr:unnamed protein product [Commensalibacter communis]
MDLTVEKISVTKLARVRYTKIQAQFWWSNLELNMPRIIQNPRLLICYKIRLY